MPKQQNTPQLSDPQHFPSQSDLRQDIVTDTISPDQSDSVLETKNALAEDETQISVNGDEHADLTNNDPSDFPKHKNSEENVATEFGYLDTVPVEHDESDASPDDGKEDTDIENSHFDAFVEEDDGPTEKVPTVQPASLRTTRPIIEASPIMAMWVNEASLNEEQLVPGQFIHNTTGHLHSVVLPSFNGGFRKWFRMHRHETRTSIVLACICSLMIIGGSIILVLSSTNVPVRSAPATPPTQSKDVSTEGPIQPMATAVGGNTQYEATPTASNNGYVPPTNPTSGPVPKLTPDPHALSPTKAPAPSPTKIPDPTQVPTRAPTPTSIPTKSPVPIPTLIPTKLPVATP